MLLVQSKTETVGMYFSAIHHEKQIQNVPCKSFMLKHTQMERGVPSFSCKSMGRDAIASQFSLTMQHITQKK
jgi:hypothetical protein